MDALEQARAEIDAVDAQLAALFERRMAAVLQVARYKQAHGLPIFDAAREAAVLEKAAARIQDPALRPYYRDHVQDLMDTAKQYEAAVLGQNRAAYQGVEGAFAHIALKALFPHAEAVSYPTWDEVFAAVARGMPPTAWCPLRTATRAMFPPCWICATTIRSCGWWTCMTCPSPKICWCCPVPSSQRSAACTATSRPLPRARPS